MFPQKVPQLYFLPLHVSCRSRLIKVVGGMDALGLTYKPPSTSSDVLERVYALNPRARAEILRTREMVILVNL